MEAKEEKTPERSTDRQQMQSAPHSLISFSSIALTFCLVTVPENTFFHFYLTKHPDM